MKFNSTIFLNRNTALLPGSRILPCFQTWALETGYRYNYWFAAADLTGLHKHLMLHKHFNFVNKMGIVILPFTKC